MAVHAPRTLAPLLLLAACSLPTQGLAPSRDSGVYLDGAARADAGDGCVGATETCNGLDDDCDGTVDEGCDCTPGATRACGSDVGLCREGTQTCTSAGAWGDCVGEVGPAAEVCDGSLDEDCDGAIDNGCVCTADDTRPCPGGTNQGVCQRGTQTCAAGAWAACVGRVEPGAEVCDGSLDEDCDGMVDNGCACANGDTQPCPGGSSIGECRAGTQICASGAWGSCSGSVVSGTETCNGLDDDCNGTVDDGGVCDSQADCIANTRSGGHAYLFCDAGGSGLNWNAAEAACEGAGYHLVTVNDNAENTWIRDQVGGSGDWWIGLTDRVTENSFVWTDGTPACNTGQQAGPPYCHWRNRTPDGRRGQNCVRMQADEGSGEWNDYGCSTRFPFVCEAP